MNLRNSIFVKLNQAENVALRAIISFKIDLMVRYKPFVLYVQETDSLYVISDEIYSKVYIMWNFLPRYIFSTT